MHEKTARVELSQLIKAAQSERIENIKRAVANGRCDPRDGIQPYCNKAFLGLIQGINELVGLVEQ